MPSHDLPTLLRQWWSTKPSQPLLTYYGPDSVRIELSGATVANYVSKTTNYFREELLTDPGDVLNVVLPLHWQSPILVWSAWAAGLTVSLDDDQDAIAIAAADPVPTRAEVQLAISVHPWGMPMGAATPTGWTDLAAQVRMQPDLAPAPTWPAADQPWLQAEGVALGAEQLLGLAGQSMANPVVAAAEPTTPEALVTMVAAPAVAGGRLIIADRVPGTDLA